MLANRLDRPVVDQTGITDAFDFQFDWNTGINADETGPSVFAALREGLGLRLEARNLPV